MFDTIKEFIGNLATSGFKQAQIDLLREVIADAERKFSESETKNATLSKELVACREAVARLERVNSDLQSQLPKKDEIDDDAIKILVLLFRQDIYVRITEIAAATQIPLHIVSGHLSDFSGRNHVVSDHLSKMMPVAGSVDGYRITSEGKAFLMKHHRDRL